MNLSWLSRKLVTMTTGNSCWKLAGRLAFFFCLMPGTGSADQSAEPLVRYRLTLEEDLTEVLVEARYASDDLALSASEGSTSALDGLESCSGGKIRVEHDSILPRDSDGCLRYRYPLRAQSGRRSPPVLTGVMVTTPNEWLWTPELIPGEFVQVELNVSDDMGLSVPWTPIESQRFELSASPGSSVGTAVFGSFTPMAVPIGEATLRVAPLGGPGLDLDAQKVRDWLAVAAQDVASVGGRFPNPDLQVIVQAVSSRGRSPVPFGYVIRDGGEAVRFYVDPARPFADYLADWTATHEFSHLLLPYVRSREKWVSEGFASYYQNVLLARRGAYSETEVWSRLTTSFERAGEISNPPALDRLHERSFREVRMLVYWSGAAMALMADLQLRELSGGRASLDTALGALADCCLPSELTWTAQELFERLDALTGERVFMPLFERFMSHRGMPELSGLYAELGIDRQGGEVRLTTQGRLAAVREAIMRSGNN